MLRMIRLGLLMPLCLALMPAAGAWAAQGDLIALIKGGKERATLLASHQLDLCLEAADHIGFLVDGQLKSLVASSSTTPAELSRQARELRGK